MKCVYKSNVVGYLSVEVGQVDTTITVTSATAVDLPAIVVGQEYLVLTLSDTTAAIPFEVVKVTSISSNVLTVERNLESTGAGTFPIATTEVSLRIPSFLLDNVLVSKSETETFVANSRLKVNSQGQLTQEPIDVAYTWSRGQATAAQTDFTVSGADITGVTVKVYLHGVKQQEALDYAITYSAPDSTVAFTQGLQEGTIVDIGYVTVT
tara:strand:- start:91 stop:717 length:627 start_codon:yes stop_codon:yes gene_type:complete